VARRPTTATSRIRTPCGTREVDKAHIIVCTIPDDVLKGTSNLQLAKVLRQIAPKAIIIVNAVQIADVKAMYEAGADYVFLSRFDSALNLIPAIDAALGGTIAQFRAAQLDRLGKERLEVFHRSTRAS